MSASVDQEPNPIISAHTIIFQKGLCKITSTVSKPPPKSKSNNERPDPAAFLPSSGRGFGEFVFHTRDDCADVYTSLVSLAEKRGRIVFQRRAELEDIYLSMAGVLVEDVLTRDCLRREEIDFVVPAQISAGFLSRLPAVIGFPGEKVVNFSDRLPDTLSTSLFLALKLAMADCRPVPGQKALLLACGSGITVAAATYRF